MHYVVEMECCLRLVQSPSILPMVGHLLAKVVVSCPARDRQMQETEIAILLASGHPRRAEMDVY